MADKVLFHPRVADDLGRAAAYYDEIAVGLGNRFRVAVRNRIRTVATRPESYGRIHGDLRAAQLDVFPYVVVFEHAVAVTRILGVFHVASDSARWEDRAAHP